MGKIFITLLISILPLNNISHPYEVDPYTTYIQEKLIDLGLLDIATGINDKNTQEAIKTFQKKVGLVVDGMVGYETFPKLLLGESAYLPTPNTTLPPVPTTTLSILDTVSPVWDVDSSPYASEIGTLFNLNIPSVTDNVGVVSYEVYVNGSLSTYVTISDTQLFVTPKYDMACADQLIYVIAFDDAGNSSQSPTFTIPQSDPCISTNSSGGDGGSSGGGGGQGRSGGSSSGFLVNFGVSGLDTDVAGVAIDSSDNIYITGTSQGANLFGKNVTSGTTDDIFVAKLNSSGVVQWVYAAGGTGRDRGRKIALDSSGNIYVTGYYWSTVDFGGGNVTSNGNWDAFLLKLNSSGTFQWVKSYGSNYNDLGRDVAIDSNDNIYMLGNYRGTVDFGGGDENGAVNGDIFLVKFNSSGVFQWVYTAGASSADDSRALALDSNDNPYITGSFQSTVNFGGGNITAANTDDLFILKLNSSGAYQNIYTSNIFTTQKGKGLAVDSSGNIYATGTFSGTVDFGGGNITTSGNDIYLLKLNSSLAFQWVKRFAVDNGEASLALGLAVTVDEDGNVYSVGQIGSTIDLGGGSQIFGGQNDAYIVKHDSSGSFQWSKTFGSGSQNNIDKAQDIVIDSNGFVIAVGEVESQNIDFTSVGGEILTNFVTGDNPNFVLKI
ncbi:SBBP repeat-containing protein, partial [Acidimicrobiaceae bacterium]|nr:SBBP repeat-containing protein [Acidimicrobiaceae bacterium]